MTLTDDNRTTDTGDASLFVESWAAMWRDHDGERWPSLLHEGAVLRNPFGELSRSDLPGYMAGLVASIADHRISPLGWGATSDGVFIEWLMTGRRGAAAFEIRGVDRFRLSGGRAVEGVAYFDPTPLLAPDSPGADVAAPEFDIRTFAREYDQAWQAKDPDAISAMHAENGTYQLHVAGLPETQGRTAMRAAFASSLANWRELSFSFEMALYGDSFYIWQATMHGILAQPLELGAVTIPANGKTLALRGIDVISLDENGLIASKESYFDLVAAANQASMP
jgi:steroid delta-isomerase-like uncharacterized protein